MPGGPGILGGCLILITVAPAPTQGTAPGGRLASDSSERLRTIADFHVNFKRHVPPGSQKPMLDMPIDGLGANTFRLDPYGLINWEAKNDNENPNVVDWEHYNERYSIPTFEASWASGRYLKSREYGAF